MNGFSRSYAILAVYGTSPGGEPMVQFGWNLLHFLSGTLGPIILGLGIATAAVSWILGSRDGLQRAFYAAVGGALLLGIDKVIESVSGAAR